MNLLAPQSLALICSLVLALPPGWCGGCAAADVPTKIHESSDGCCQASAATTPTGRGTAAQPADAPDGHFCACCVSPDGTRPAPSTSPETAVPAAWLLAAPHNLAVDRVVEVTAPPRVEGPRLHVLKCVWRC